MDSEILNNNVLLSDVTEAVTGVSLPHGWI
jgi:hypothetical protein